MWSKYLVINIAKKKRECNKEVEFLPFIKVKFLLANARDVQVSVEEK